MQRSHKFSTTHQNQKIQKSIKRSVQVFLALLTGLVFCLDRSVYANSATVLNNEKAVEANAFDENDESAQDSCAGLEFSEIYTYYPSGESSSEQFVEIFNTNEDDKVNLAGCKIEYYILYTKDMETDANGEIIDPGDNLGTLKVTIELSGEVKPQDYFVWFSDDTTKFTKNPDGIVTWRLLDRADDNAESDAEPVVLDSYSYDNQKESRSWAWFGADEDGEEVWNLTYNLTPGAENIRQDCKDTTKVLNEATGRCVNGSTGDGDDDEEGNENSAVDPDLPAQCAGLEFSEILTYYEDDQSEQFIEIHNSTTEKMYLDGCSIHYKSKVFALSGVLDADAYLANYVTETSLTKNPSKSNELTIVDVNGTVQDTLVYYHGQKKGVAYAQFDYLWTGEENWEQTYAPTPGEANVYQQYKTCPEGKVINESTGNCVKVSTTTALADCPEGKYRNPLTNRCKSISSTTSTLKECAEGYERNPETNRCRKVVSNSGADYAFALDTSEGETNFVAFGIIGAVGGLGGGYVIWQFRREIGKGIRKIIGKFRPKKANAIP